MTSRGSTAPHNPTLGIGDVPLLDLHSGEHSRGTLYIGVTNIFLGRVGLHRAGKGAGFTSRYRASMLVYFEEFNDVEGAIQREKTLKHYVR